MNGLVVNLQALDNTTITVSIEQANQMGTIKNVLQDKKGDDHYIPLRIKDGHILFKLQEFLETHQVDTREMSDKAFIGFLEAANYLEFERLVYHLMPVWVNGRPFPASKELKEYIEPALYFYSKSDFGALDVPFEMKAPFMNFIRKNGYWNWNIRMAACSGSVKIVKRLLQDPKINPEADSNFAIIMAVEYNNVGVVECLLQDSRVNPCARNNTALSRAVAKNAVDVVALFLQDSRVDPAFHDNHILRSAARFGYVEIVDMLMKDSRVNPSAQDNAAFEWAMQYNQKAVAKRLLQDAMVKEMAKEKYKSGH